MRKIKKLFSIFCAGILFFTILSPSSFSIAESEPKFAGGNGTESAPYLIETKEQLNNVRNHLDGYFQLVSDITFSDLDFEKNGAFYNDGKGWLSIGNESNPFCGTFDGNGHIINGLYISVINSRQNIDRFYGLFGYSNGSINNLSLTSSIEGSCSKQDYCTYIGGLCAYNKGAISNCNFNGFIDICMSFAPGFSTTVRLDVGGISGDNSGTIIRAYNNADISVKHKIVGEGYAEANVGGVSGFNQRNSQSGDTGECYIKECYNCGNIDCESSYLSYAGGIAGNNARLIGSCYNAGDVVASSISNDSYAGGIIGSNQGGVSCCYSVSKFISACNKGGIVGKNSKTITSCLFLRSDNLYDGYDAYSMLCPLTYSGFNFESIWQWGQVDYPFPVLSNVSNTAKYQISLKENTIDFAGGIGSSTSPFLVSSINELINVKKYSTCYFKLINDIALNISEYETDGLLPNGWIPFVFNGSFDGNGYSINNLKWEYNPPYTGKNPGLFTTNNGTIKNLTVDGPVITVKNYGSVYGGFIAAENNGTILNCHTKDCNIILTSTEHYFGCIAGSNSGTIQDCTSNNSVSWQSIGGRAGGIVSTNSGTIKCCTNYSAITNIGPYYPISGGVAAQNSGTISFSRNLAPILSKSTYSQRSAKAGGIVGEMTGGNITQCYNSGDVAAIATEYKADTYSGGLAAVILNSSIDNCYNTADIYGESSYAANSHIGGLIGYNDSNNIITYCYSIGSNSGKSSSGNLNVGYICGLNSSNGFTDCYYLGLSNNGSGVGVSSTMFGLKLSELKNQESYNNFDFEKVWTMDGNELYPFPELLLNQIDYKGEIIGISILTLPNKTKYIQNYESLDVSGGTLKVDYTYGVSKIVDFKDATILGFDNTEFGKKTLNVDYFGFSTTFDIEILCRYGDINADNLINSSDALLVLQYTVGLAELEQKQCVIADVNKDSVVNSTDTLLILQYTVGIINIF